MSEPVQFHKSSLDLSRWRHLSTVFLIVGAAFSILGAVVDTKQFGFSWLQGFMFFLSFGVGSLFLVMAHHLFDASWSVGIRRFMEHMACLMFPWLAILFIPIAILAPRLYPWMTADPATDHALRAKLPLFTQPMFYIVAAFCFITWGIIAHRLRYWSLQQDKTGEAKCTYRMRVISCLGVVFFALTVTIAAIMWMKSLMYEWFSTMYGVYYFAGSVWMTLATVYLIAVILKETGSLRSVLLEKQFYFIGSLLFAFTVFYAYVTFFQYFIIWNANIPEETFWFVLREKGTWWDLGLVIIFGHFLLPFLMLLRIDWKLKLGVMLPLAAWAWLMHYCDMAFNIGPSIHPDGFTVHWMDAACALFMGGLLIKVFVKSFLAHPPFPQRDPRMAEGLDIYTPSSTDISTAPGRAK